MKHEVKLQLYMTAVIALTLLWVLTTFSTVVFGSTGIVYDACSIGEVTLTPGQLIYFTSLYSNYKIDGMLVGIDYEAVKTSSFGQKEYIYRLIFNNPGKVLLTTGMGNEKCEVDITVQNLEELKYKERMKTELEQRDEIIEAMRAEMINLREDNDAKAKLIEKTTYDLGLTSEQLQILNETIENKFVEKRPVFATDEDIDKLADRVYFRMVSRTSFGFFLTMYWQYLVGTFVLGIATLHYKRQHTLAGE